MSNTTVAPAPASLYAGRWLALTALLTAEAMNLLDATIVQVAAPSMRSDLGGSTGDVQWFTAGYTLPFAVLLVLGGRLGDIVGRCRVFVVGLAGFTLLSLCCALAPSAGLLIAFRAAQGSCAALVIPQTIGIIKGMFAGPEVGKALGTIGPVMGLAGVAGPVLGGVLTHADLFGSSWRAVFLVNIPLGLGVLAISGSIRENRAAVSSRLDLPGTALLAAAVAALIYPLIDTGGHRSAAVTTAMLSTGALLVAAFALQQRRAARRDLPTSVEPSLFSGRTFPAALVVSTAFFAVMNGLMLVVVVELQVGLHVDPLTAGLTLLPWSFGLGISSWVAGAYLVPRFGDRLMIVGLGIELLGIAGCVLAYRTGTTGQYPAALLPALGVCGIGIGLFSPTFFTTTLHHVAPAEIGSAAGLLNAVQQFGATVGVAVLGTVFFDVADRAGATQSARGAATAFLTAAAILVVAAVATRGMIDPRRDA